MCFVFLVLGKRFVGKGGAFAVKGVAGINERETVSKALQRSLQSRATESVTTSDTATKIGRGFQKNMKKLSKIIEKFVEI